MKDHETQENAAPGGTCAADGSACRIFVHPGHVVSRMDGDLHFVPAGRLAELCGVRLRDYIIVDKHHPQNEHGYEKQDGDIHLYPRRDGDYRRVPNVPVSGPNGVRSTGLVGKEDA